MVLLRELFEMECMVGRGGRRIENVSGKPESAIMICIYPSEAVSGEAGIPQRCF